MGEDHPQDIAAAEAQIRDELYEFMVDELEISDLIFHTVFLNPLTMDTDSVGVAPAGGDDPMEVECYYYPITEWVTVNALDK